MDGESFDRLSVAVDRLRQRATRRGALLAVLGGALAGIGAASGDDAEAKKKNRKNCRGYGGRCDRNNDCCNGRCINGFCFYTGNGGGGGNNYHNCGNQTCPNGWRCCKQNGVKVCVPAGYPTCCGNYSYSNGYYCCNGNYGGACFSGGDCCPGANGTGCCQSGWKCCGNGRCCPRGWYCGNIACYANQDAAVSAQSVESIPFAMAEPANEDDRVYIGDKMPGESKPQD
ncbi:MAG: hypothetical protein U0031_02410 [Thermomicrobiales bacterium]